MSGGLTSTVPPLRVSTVSMMTCTKSPALLLMVDQAQPLEEEKDNRNPDLLQVDMIQYEYTYFTDGTLNGQ